MSRGREATASPTRAISKSPRPEERVSQPYEKPIDVSQPPPGFIPPPVTSSALPIPTSIPGYVVPHPGITMPVQFPVDDPLAAFNRFLSSKSRGRDHRDHRDDYRSRYHHRPRSRSRTPPPHYRRYPRSPPYAYRLVFITYPDYLWIAHVSF